MQLPKKINEYKANIELLEKKKSRLVLLIPAEEKLSGNCNGPFDGNEGMSNIKEGDDHVQKNVEVVNALEYMRKGCSMLKYGRYGYPHFRYFELSMNCEEFTWYSPKQRTRNNKNFIS